MATNDWKSVLAKLDVTGGSVNPVTAKEIAQFEAETKFLLPKSYCGYCTTIGPGILVTPDSYKISVPGAKSEHYNLLTFNDVMKVVEGKPSIIRELFARSWLFAVDIGNGLYFWDPLEITRPGDNEYAIYIMYEDYKLDRLADTFWGFVTKICLVSGPPGYVQSENELTFEPRE